MARDPHPHQQPHLQLAPLQRADAAGEGVDEDAVRLAERGVKDAGLIVVLVCVTRARPHILQLTSIDT
jgi:hypothetical protein